MDEFKRADIEIKSTCALKHTYNSSVIHFCLWFIQGEIWQVWDYEDIGHYARQTVHNCDYEGRYTEERKNKNTRIS